MTHSDIDELRRKDNMILYTDTVQGKQTLRDDMWAVSTEELEAYVAAQQLALLDRLEKTLPKKMFADLWDDGEIELSKDSYNKAIDNALTALQSERERIIGE